MRSLLFCLGGPPHQVKTVTRKCGEASFIGSHGLFFPCDLEQGQLLNNSRDTTFPVCRRAIRGFPVEQPLMGTEIKQGQLR